MVFLSEISQQKLDKFPQVDAWIQIACPRISIDWGHDFRKPLLNTYEANVLLNQSELLVKSGNQHVYPMDYYSNEGGEWSNYFKQQ